MTTFFTSDPHLWHPLVAGLRGFADPAEWSEQFAQTWREQVGRNDVVWVLGDLALGKWREALQLVADLPGTKHLVSGNHDKCWPGDIDGARHQRAYLEVFETVGPFARKKVAGRKVSLSHFPIEGDHTETSRADQWRLRPFDGVLLHGHTHGPEVLTTFQSGEFTTTQIHVGLDAWDLRLVSEDEVAALCGIPPKETALG